MKDRNDLESGGRYARRTNTTRERSPTASTARAPIAGPPGHAQALTSSVRGGGNATNDHDGDRGDGGGSSRTNMMGCVEGAGGAPMMLVTCGPGGVVRDGGGGAWRVFYGAKGVERGFWRSGAVFS